MDSAGASPFETKVPPICAIIKKNRSIFRHRTKSCQANYNHSLLAELSHVQSSRWSLIARNHINVVSKIVSQFMNLALAHVIKDVEVRENMDCLIRAVLEAYVEASESELARLLEDETRHPITYNHNYTENIQKGRDQKSKSHLEQSQRNSIQIDLFASRRRSVVVDMKEQACLDAQIDLNAYYKVCASNLAE